MTLGQLGSWWLHHCSTILALSHPPLQKETPANTTSRNQLHFNGCSC